MNTLQRLREMNVKMKNARIKDDMLRHIVRNVQIKISNMPPTPIPKEKEKPSNRLNRVYKDTSDEILKTKTNK